MSERQQTIRLFIQDRLTAAAVEIFGVLEKTISEYEEQVVQSKREVDQLKQDIRHLNTVKPHMPHIRIDSQPVSDELLPLQHLNPRQELMNSQEDEAVQHQSPQVIEEQVDLSVESQTTSDSQLIPSYETVQQCPQVKEEQVELCIIPYSETSIFNSGAHGFVKSETTSSDRHLIHTYSTVTVVHSRRAEEEQMDLGIIPDSETSISNIATNGFVQSESTSDSQLFPSRGTETVITNHNVANNSYKSEGSAMVFSQSADVYCIVQKICCFCRKQLHSYAELMKHVEESHTVHKAFKCPDCDREFARRDTWEDHCRIHTGVKPHSCPVCGKLFTQHSCLEVHMRIIHTDSQPVSEELLHLQHLNPRQELMSSQKDEAVQHQSPQVKEEQVDLCIIPDSETSIYNCGKNGFVTSETTSSDRHMIPPYSTVAVEHSRHAKEEQMDLIPDSETSISNIVTNGSVTSASSSDSQLFPSHGTETVITNHDVANNSYKSEGSAMAFSQSADVYCIVQKICCFCRKQFHSYAELMKHVEESHTGQTAFKCPDCDREFARRDTWEDHCRIHTGVKPHSCPVCGKLFTQHSCLEVHMRRIHTDSQPVSEELLPYQHLNPRQELMSSQKDEAAQHQSPQVKDHQVDLSNIPHSETSIYNCGINGFGTSESTSDSQPIHYYTTEAVITSDNIADEYDESDGSGLTFSQRDNDIFFMEQIICSICSKQFHRDTDLIKHMKDTHTGHKAFKCPKCDRDYNRRDKLAIHYRVHTGVKPHSCPVCGKSFTQRSCLTVHMRIHTGEKPYFCNKCGKMVAYSYHLKRCQM